MFPRVQCLFVGATNLHHCYLLWPLRPTVCIVFLNTFISARILYSIVYRCPCPKKGRVTAITYRMIGFPNNLFMQPHGLSQKYLQYVEKPIKNLLLAYHSVPEAHWQEVFLNRGITCYIFRITLVKLSICCFHSSVIWRRMNKLIQRTRSKLNPIIV